MFRRHAYADGEDRAGSGPSAVTTARGQVARVIGLLTSLVVGIIVIAIVLQVLDANEGNAIVGFLVDAGDWLTAPFQGIFDLDERRWQIAVNWGIAAVVYSIVGRLLARLAAR